MAFCWRAQPYTDAPRLRGLGCHPFEASSKKSRTLRLSDGSGSFGLCLSHALRSLSVKVASEAWTGFTPGDEALSVETIGEAPVAAVACLAF
jgi:hypothetical protein